MTSEDKTTPQAEVDKVKRSVDVFNAIRQYFVEEWGAKFEDITLETPLINIVGKASEDKLYFESVIQQKFGINIADNAKIRTVGNLADFIVNETNKLTYYLVAKSVVAGRGPKYEGPATQVTLGSLSGSEIQGLLRLLLVLINGRHDCKFTLKCGNKTILPQDPNGKAAHDSVPYDVIRIGVRRGNNGACGVTSSQSCPAYMAAGLCPLFRNVIKDKLLGKNK